MRLTAAERAERREAFRRMGAAEKVDYIFSYYKLPIVLALLFAYVLCYGAWRHFSRKEVLLYVACANVALGEDMQEALCDEFVRASGGDTRTQTVYLYRELYLSGDPALVNHEYAYASRLKLLAAIDARQLDLVLMNREAYNLLSEGGYLLELSSRLDSEGLRGFLTENRVILQDNSLDIALGEAETYQATVVQEANALEVTQFPLFRDAGFTDSVFLGVLPDSPRMSAALDYIAYLCA
ncbi:MAG: hypothetical protein IJR48_01805 [Oscillibacter sp.]|nr:hypothetical protein [Oscillibacter sp.]